MRNSSVHGAHALDATSTPPTVKENAPPRQDATCVCVRCIRVALQTSNCSPRTTQMFVFGMYCCSTCHACLLRKDVGDTFKLVGLKSKSQDAPAPMTTTADRGRRDIKTNWTPDAQTFTQAAGTSQNLSNDRPSIQFAISTVMTRMSPLKVTQQLQVTRGGTCQTTLERHGSSIRETRKSSI